MRGRPGSQARGVGSPSIRAPWLLSGKSGSGSGGTYGSGSGSDGRGSGGTYGSGWYRQIASPHGIACDLAMTPVRLGTC